MKKMILLLAVLLMTAPAMAAVTITVSDQGDGWAVISYDANGTPDFIRAFALDITASNDVNFVAYDGASADYWVYPGSIDINDAGEVNDAGSPIAGAGFPAVTLGGLDTNGVTIEMGALFEAGVDPDPCDSGVLLKLQLDPDATADGAEICVVGNAIRGNIVLKDASSEDPAEACAVVAVVAPSGCACLGDVSSPATSGVPDGLITGADIGYVNTLLVLYGGRTRTILSTDGDFDLCADVSSPATSGVPDSLITGADIGYINTRLVLEGGRTRTITCP